MTEVNSPAHANRPTPAAAGEIQKTPFVHVLVYACERTLTGTLELVQPNGGPTAAIAFVDGNVTKIRTSENVLYLGKVLQEMGVISPSLLEASLSALAEGGRLHGEILVSAGAITRAQLVTALEAQLARKLLHVFSFPPATSFAFYDHYDALKGYGGEEALAVDLLPVIWRGILAAPPWEHVDAALGRVASAYLRVRSGVDLGRFLYEADVANVLRALGDQPTRVGDFVSASGLSAQLAQLVLYGLIVTRHIEVVDPVALTTMATSPAAPPGSDPAVVLPPSASTLRVERTSSPKVAIGGKRGTASGQFAATQLAPERAQPKPSEGAMPVSAVDPAARRAQILEMAARIEGQSYFEVLGVSQDATTAEIELSFMNLAKRWHPDRLPAALADVREACTRVFGRLSEAHKALSDVDGRAKYVELLKDGGATPEAQEYIARVVDAAMTFQKAEVCMKRSDFLQAESLCRQAHHADPSQADYGALLAWLECMHPENQGEAATYERIAVLDKALMASPQSARAYYYRAMLHKKVGSTPLAIEDFRKVVELNPSNVDAVREIRLFEARKGSTPRLPAERDASADGAAAAPRSAPTSKLGGLFGKLLKKD